MAFTQSRVLAMTEIYIGTLVVLAYSSTMLRVLGYSPPLQTSKKLHIFDNPTMMTSFLPTVSGTATLVVESVMSRLHIAHVYGNNTITLLPTRSLCAHAHVE